MKKFSKQDFIKVFRALANEERLGIVLKLYEEGELCASAIEKNFFMEQSTTSHHLNYLRTVGILVARKQGRNIYYSVDAELLTRLYDDFLKTQFNIKKK